MPEQLKSSLNKSIEILKENQDKPVEEQNAAPITKGVISVKNLPIYEDHSTTAKVIGGLVEGNPLSILETWTDGNSTWGRLGPDQWVLLDNDGEKLVELTSE